MNRSLRVALLCDLAEEGWPSMDLVSEMLAEGLRARASHALQVERIQPAFRRLLRRDGLPPHSADRLLNRMWLYPRHVRRLRDRFDLFHVVDHSYSQLVTALPAGRTVVTCHDLDTFRCVSDPIAEPRSVPFRMMTRRILHGLTRAARVVCDSEAVRGQLLAAGLVSPERAAVVPLAPHPLFRAAPDPGGDQPAEKLLGPAGEHVDLLHVGNVSPRKRLDLLLTALAGLRRTLPAVRLLRVGGPFTTDQDRLVEQLGVRAAIRVLPALPRLVLAAVYRRAVLTLLPSDREGFGLTLLESLACGTPVIASGIPALREVGGGAVRFVAPGDVKALVEAVETLLAERRQEPERWRRRVECGIHHAEAYTWEATATGMMSVYRQVLE